MSKPATIRRSKHDASNKYFVMRRDTAQDESLSWEARGILCYLLSKPDDWEISVSDLKQQCGKSKVYRILDELKEARYLEDRTKYQDKDGRWQWTPYILHEQPMDDKMIPYPENQETDTVSRKPEHGKPDTENREIEQSTDNKVQKQSNTIAPEVSDALATALTNMDILCLPPPAKTQRSPKQQANDEKVQTLGDAFGIEAQGDDYGLYVKTANKLLAAGIELDEFGRYIKRVRRRAKEQGGWTVTIPSLTAKGRPSEYVASRDAYEKRQERIKEMTTIEDTPMPIDLQWLYDASPNNRKDAS